MRSAAGTVAAVHEAVKNSHLALPLLTMPFGNQRMFTVEDVAARLGFSLRHARRLVEAGELEACQPPDAPGCMVVASAVTDFEERRSAAERRADEFSHALDDAGAPPE